MKNDSANNKSNYSGNGRQSLDFSLRRFTESKFLERGCQGHFYPSTGRRERFRDFQPPVRYARRWLLAFAEGVERGYQWPRKPAALQSTGAPMRSRRVFLKDVSVAATAALTANPFFTWATDRRTAANAAPVVVGISRQLWRNHYQFVIDPSGRKYVWARSVTRCVISVISFRGF